VSRLLAVVAFLLAGLLAVSPADSIKRASAPRTEEEKIAAAIRESQIVVLARVIGLDSIATPWKPELLLEAMRRRAVLEPIEYVKGGLDGETIDAYIVESDLRMNPTPPLRQLVHADTLATFFFLRSDKADWYMGADWVGNGGPLPQRTWSAQMRRLKALADSADADSSRVAPPNRSAH
jgi:hypothetical protein